MEVSYMVIGVDWQSLSHAVDLGPWVTMTDLQRYQKVRPVLP